MIIRSLRAKLVASHILPVLFLIPILTLYLLYFLEEWFDSSLLQQLSYQARLLQNRAQVNPSVVENPPAAQNFLAGISGLTDARVVLLSRDAIILASTRKEDLARIGTRHPDESVMRALNGQVAEGIGPGFSAEVAFVILPLRDNGVTV
ncbi:MAG: hypothetical protein AB1817_20885, partial [Chloroflexota bacterium]